MTEELHNVDGGQITEIGEIGEITEITEIGDITDHRSQSKEITEIKMQIMRDEISRSKKKASHAGRNIFHHLSNFQIDHCIVYQAL